MVSLRRSLVGLMQEVMLTSSPVSTVSSQPSLADNTPTAKPTMANATVPPASAAKTACNPFVAPSLCPRKSVLNDKATTVIVKTDGPA